ncbi:MAG: 2Fe-2S iron-sulfur cluster-binding protein [Pseudomonadota bacterium]|nr:2Fe-2S iron-sulfur cluster-binding protein [Pseudomonadota bacterium]
MVKVTFIYPKGERREVEGEPGETLLTVARRHGIDEIEGACGGAMACATCHVIVDAAWYGKLPSPVADETDMLDLASGLTKTSRLGCQITLTDALNGLTVKLPPNFKGLFK